MKERERGFTLIEALIGVFILAVVGYAAYEFQRNTFSLSRIISDGLSAQMQARTTLKRLSSELRTASPSSIGSYALETVSTSTLTFYTNIDTDSVQERLRYFMSGTTLRRGVLKPTGSPLTYNTANEVVTDLVHHVANSSSTPVFSYYDSSYNGTTTPLSSPVTASTVRLIKIVLHIDANTSKPPDPLVLTTQITMRNLKDNL